MTDIISGMYGISLMCSKSESTLKNTSKSEVSPLSSSTALAGGASQVTLGDLALCLRFKKKNFFWQERLGGIFQLLFEVFEEVLGPDHD